MNRSSPRKRPPRGAESPLVRAVPRAGRRVAPALTARPARALARRGHRLLRARRHRCHVAARNRARGGRQSGAGPLLLRRQGTAAQAVIAERCCPRSPTCAAAHAAVGEDVAGLVAGFVQGVGGCRPTSLAAGAVGPRSAVRRRRAARSAVRRTSGRNCRRCWRAVRPGPAARRAQRGSRPAPAGLAGRADAVPGRRRADLATPAGRRRLDFDALRRHTLALLDRGLGCG